MDGSGRWMLAVPVVLAWAWSPGAWARAFYVESIPNGPAFNCSTCHINPAGAGPRNAFGLQVAAHLNVLPRWPEFYNLDADGDGFTNGEELGDPCGLYRDPGNLTPPMFNTGMTRPADPASVPLQHTLSSCFPASSSSAATSQAPSSSSAAATSSVPASSSAAPASSLVESSSLEASSTVSTGVESSSANQGGTSLGSTSASSAPRSSSSRRHPVSSSSRAMLVASSSEDSGSNDGAAGCSHAATGAGGGWLVLLAGLGVAGRWRRRAT